MPLTHVAAGDGADPGHAEDLADLGLAGDDLLELGGEHADHGLLDVLEHLVDDLVGADLDVFGVGQLAGLAVGAHVEADDRGVGRGGERDVVLGDAADGAVHERELHLVALELAEALGERLERALHVGLQDQVQRGRLARLDLVEDVLELHAAVVTAGVAALVRQPLPLLAGLGDRLGRLLVGGDTELVAGARHRRQAEHLHRRRRAGFLDLLALVVDQRPHAAPRRAGDDRVADLQRALVDEDGGDRAAADVEVGLEHDALGPALGVGGELLDARRPRRSCSSRSSMPRSLQRRHLDHDRVAAPRLGHEAVLGELLHHPLRIGVRRGRSC